MPINIKGTLRKDKYGRYAEQMACKCNLFLDVFRFPMVLPIQREVEFPVYNLRA
ncbi:MAG: hypothetical protein JWN92_1029 [Candidatus Acidoferrum typicum]|jgi:hypothetical protein|nr:hypothetical protein [Candidatus Acidoferrum typicum]